MKFDVWTRITGTFRPGVCTCMVISCSFLLKMRGVSDKSCRENLKKIMFNPLALEIDI